MIHKWKDIITDEDDFKRFLIKHKEIVYINDLNKQFRGLYKYLLENHPDWIYNNLSRQRRECTDWNTIFKSKEDLKQFLDKNKITTREQLSKLFSGIILFYRKKKNLIFNSWFDEILPPTDRIPEYDSMSNLIIPKINIWNQIIKNNSDLDKFIKDNNIVSISDLSDRYSGLRKYLDREKDLLNYSKKIFNLSEYDSRWESRFEKFLLNLKINYLYHKIICGTRLEIDFYLPDYRIGIEIQGPTHTNWKNPIYGKSQFIQQRKRDIKKKKLCSEMNIKLLYFSFDYSLVYDWDKGFPYYIYTSFSLLKIDLLKLCGKLRD